MEAKDRGSGLVKVYPAETTRDKKSKRILSQTSWHTDASGRFFNVGLSIKELKPFLVKERVKLPNVLMQDEGDFLVYGYKGRPLLKLNRTDGQFYSSATEIQNFGSEAVAHQAHVLLDLLKRNGLSKAVMGRQVQQQNARQTLSSLGSYKKS